MLMVNFDPGAERQPWNLSRGPEASMFVEGSGNPKEIVAKVCSVVNQGVPNCSNKLVFLINSGYPTACLVPFLRQQ
jgi:hypothetical protein